MKKITQLQTQYSSSFDKRKICSYDIERIDKPTHPIMHQESRFLYIQKGRGTMIINGSKYELEKNSCVAIVPWTITEVLKVEEPLQFIKIVYNYNFLNNNIKSAYTSIEDKVSFFNNLSDNPVIYCNNKEAETLNLILNDLKEEVGVESILEVKDDKILSNLFITNKIIELLIFYVRVERREKNKSKILNVSKNIVDKKANIFNYLYSHLSEKQTLKSVSSLFFISESTLAKYCNKVTGHSFHTLLDEMRLVKTMDFLMYTDFSLNVIAELVGFNDASHLSKFFSKKIGTTPNQYRKINKNIINILNSDEKNLNFEIIKYINSNFIDNINEVETAKLFGISVVELNKILLYTMEKNFDDLINFLRINYACELLKSTDDTILDIAIAVGYNNAKTFSNHFNTLKKISPSSFRKTVTIQYDYD